MMTKLFLKMMFLWYVNYRLHNFINVKHLYNFLYFCTLIFFMVSFFLCYWKLVPDSLIFIFFMVLLQGGRAYGQSKSFCFAFYLHLVINIRLFSAKQQLSSIACFFFMATSTAAGAFHKFLILQQKWHLLKLKEECYGYLTQKPGSN